MREELAEQIRSVARESFSRSGGPGGQNVNKLNTQVTLHVPLPDLDLSATEYQRLYEELGGRINADDELVVQSSDTRSQAQNRQIALDRAIALIAEAIRPRRTRRATKPSRAVRERRLERKRRRAAKKSMRKPPPHAADE